MFILIDILNAAEVWIEPDAAKVVTGDERAVILCSREFERQSSQPGILGSCESGYYVKLSISELRNVLSPSQNRALESEDYQALGACELRNLAVIIACAKLSRLPSSELVC